MTSDPAGFRAARPRDPQSWNRYAYVAGDPVNRFDPLGMDGSDQSGCAALFADASQPYDPYSACSGGNSCMAMIMNFEDDPDAATFYAQAAAMGCTSAAATEVAQEFPLPTCTLEVESRPLDYPVLRHSHIDLHGYLVFTSSAGTDIIEGLHQGKLLKAGLGPTGPGDNPSSNTDDGSISGTAVCASLSILQLDVSKINAANITYGGAFGPNSNSVLSYLLESLNYLLIDGSWYTIPLSMQIFGYDTALPGLN